MNGIVIRVVAALALGASAKSVVDASFDVRAPAGWTAERRADGVVLTGPSAEGMPSRVVVRFVKPDHQLYGTPEEYMARLLKPSSVPLKGWKTGEVREAKAAGRKALRVERDTVEYADAESVAPKAVAMREEHVAVTAAKGFYLLVYSAPASIDKKQRAAFRRLLDSGFKPKL